MVFVSSIILTEEKQSIVTCENCQLLKCGNELWAGSDLKKAAHKWLIADAQLNPNPFLFF